MGALPLLRKEGRGSMSNSMNKNVKSELISLIDLLLEIAQRSSHLGLMALESYKDQTSDPWIFKGLTLVLRGTDSDNILRVFRNLLQADDYSREEIWHIRIIKEAMVSISRRDSFEDMEDILFSVIGDRGRDEYRKQKKARQKQKVSDFLTKKRTIEPEGSESGLRMENFTDKQMILLLDQVNTELLGPFLAGEKHSLQCRVISFLDEQGQSDLVEQLETGFLDISIEKARKLLSYRIRRVDGEFKDEEILSQKEVDKLLRDKM